MAYIATLKEGCQSVRYRISSILGGQCPHFEGCANFDENHQKWPDLPIGKFLPIFYIARIGDFWGKYPKNDRSWGFVKKPEFPVNLGGSKTAFFWPPRYPNFDLFLRFLSQIIKKTRKNVSGHPFFLEPRGNCSNFQGQKSCLMRYCLVCTPLFGA